MNDFEENLDLDTIATSKVPSNNVYSNGELPQTAIPKKTEKVFEEFKQDEEATGDDLSFSTKEATAVSVANKIKSSNKVLTKLSELTATETTLPDGINLHCLKEACLYPREYIEESDTPWTYEMIKNSMI